MGSDCFVPRFRRLLIGVASAAVLTVVMAGAAQASPGCNALDGQSDSTTASVSGQIGNGKVFKFEAGDTITVTIVAPPNSFVSVKFLDFEATVDNVGGANAKKKTFKVVVDKNASTRVDLDISTSGGTVKISFNCKNAPDDDNNNNDNDNDDDGDDAQLNANQAAGQVDAVVQQIVPGGIDGDLFRDFGIPFVSPLNAIGFNNPGFQGIECDPAALEALLAALEAARVKLVRAERALNETNAELNEARASLAEAVAEARLGITADSPKIQRLERAKFELVKVQNKRKGAASNQAEANKEFVQAFNAFQAQKAACDRAQGASNQASAPGGTDGSFAVASAFSATGFQPVLLAPAEPALLGNDSPGSKSLSGSYSLATARAQGGSFAGLLGDKRFNAWVNGGVVFNDNDRRGLGQSGETAVVSGGASYLISPSVNVGLAARYGDTDVSGAGGSTDAEAWSGAAFTQVLLPNSFSLAGMLAYSVVDVDGRFVQPGITATGKTDADSFAGQLVLSRGFAVHGWTLAPNLGVSFVDIDRDAFTASDGTRVTGSSSTQTALTAGANLARSFIAEGPNGNRVTIVPSFGVNGFSNLGLFDPLIGLTGQDFEDDEFGVSLNGGLEVQFQDGAALGLAVTWAGAGSDQQNVQILGGFAWPF
ncbi:MAG: autotransporter domain-containing protein [Methyloceanibacter sp.]|uniref:autotransporter domain-containing protein n=1 Tax=Methyloceanibacter sp. TaxID=1965321 RepID=UPI003D6CC207